MRPAVQFHSLVPVPFLHACLYSTVVLGVVFQQHAFLTGSLNVEDMCVMFQGRLEAGADYQLHSVWPSVPFLGTQPRGPTQQRGCRGAPEQ